MPSHDIGHGRLRVRVSTARSSRFASPTRWVWYDRLASSYDNQCRNDDDVFVDPTGYACRATDDLVRLNSTKSCDFRISVVSESGRLVSVPSRWGPSEERRFIISRDQGG